MSEESLGRTEHVAALERGLSVVKLLASSEERLTLAEVAHQTGYSRAAARRFLLSLQTVGYVETDGRYFRLRRDVLDLGYAYLSSLAWWRPALHAVTGLSTTLGANCVAGVLDRGQFCVVARSVSNPVSVAGSGGTASEPAYASAGGRVLLGGMEKAERDAFLASIDPLPLTPFTITDTNRLRTSISDAVSDGHALAVQEIEIGVTAVAVPIFGRNGRPVAALEAFCRGVDSIRPEAVLAQLKSAAYAIHTEAFDG